MFANPTSIGRLPREEPEARSAPRPRRRPPVLIGDAVTPVGGTTLLALILRSGDDET